MYNQYRLKHGDASNITGKAPEYRIWEGMKRRCLNPNMTGYSDYGGKGITVCKEWQESYEIFLKDMGRKPSPKHTIERINSKGNYEPTNCKWATPKEQANNRKNNRRLKYHGESRTMTQWSELYNMPKTTLYNRLKRGWSIEDALTKPIDVRRRKKK